MVVYVADCYDVQLECSSRARTFKTCVFSKLVLGLGLALYAQFSMATCQEFDALLPLIPMAGGSDGWQGIVRVDNSRQPAVELEYVATDDAGNSYEASLSIGAGETRQFSSDDLEFGNEEKGIEGTGVAPVGNWRLCFKKMGFSKVSAYIRLDDSILTDVTLVVESSFICSERCPEWQVPIFNPASNVDQMSVLRLINNNDSSVGVVISGLKEDGSRNLDEEEVAMSVQGYIAAGSAVELTSAQLETGDGLALARCDPDDPEDCVESVGSIGQAGETWSLYVNRIRDRAYSEDLVVMNLMRTSDGHITTLPASGTDTWIRR